MNEKARSWLREYYPLTVSELVKNRVTSRDMVEHSLRKWKGLTPEVLDQHQLSIFDKVYEKVLVDESMYPVLSISDASCVLCHQFVYFDHKDNMKCEDCPLHRVLGHRCDDERNNVYKKSLLGSSEMIEALEKALEEYC